MLVISPFSAYRLWTPTELTTQFWFDSNDVSTITMVDNNVEVWQDKSGNNRHISQPDSLLRPNYLANALNNKSIVSFTLNDFLYLENIGNLFPSGFDIYVVMKPINHADGFFAYPVNIQENPVLLVLDGYNNTYAVGNVYPLLTTSFSIRDISQPTLFNYSGSTSEANIYIDGLNSFNVVTSIAYQQTGSIEFNVGSRQDRFTKYQGYIGEVVVLSSVLSLGDRQKMEGYLAHKWGLADNLPNGHPYKLAPYYYT